MSRRSAIRRRRAVITAVVVSRFDPRGPIGHAPAQREQQQADGDPA